MSQSFISSDSSSARSLRSIDMSSRPPVPPPATPANTGSAPASHRSASGGVWAADDDDAPDAAIPLIDSDEETLGELAAAAAVSQPAPEQVPGQSAPLRPAAGSRGKPALPPPPPPPRSTLPPVRPMTEPLRSRSGVGSAIDRWRGGLPEVVSKETKKGSDPAPLAGTEKEEPTDAVTRSAPSWLLSLVMHLIVLLILALISTPAGNGFTNLVLDFGISNESIDDALELDLSSPQTEDMIEAPEDATDDSLVETEIIDVFEIVQPTEMQAIEPVLLGAGSIVIAKPMFSGRSGAMRKALMAMYGGTDETADAVKLGLAWLKRQQHRTGYWSMTQPFSNGAVTENRPAATALALIAFAGDGNTHLEGPYRAEVESGVKYLVGLQDRGGFMASTARGNEQTYAQAQATIALCELYGMTKDSWLRAYAQRAIDYAIKSQASNGGWRYRPNEPGDTSVTGWYVMALQSGLGAGLDVDLGKMEMISKYLDSASVYYGAGYAYQPGGSDATPTMTAEGLLCRQYLGWERNHGALQEGLNLLRADAPFRVNDHNVYYWYYATQAFHHVGGPMWKDWNDAMKVKLPALQIKEGAERGSWAPQADRWSVGGRLYTTCLSIYCLEVYYRHLPLYDQH